MKEEPQNVDLETLSFGATSIAILPPLSGLAVGFRLLSREDCDADLALDSRASLCLPAYRLPLGYVDLGAQVLTIFFQQSGGRGRGIQKAGALLPSASRNLPLRHRVQRAQYVRGARSILRC